MPANNPQSTRRHFSNSIISIVTFPGIQDPANSIQDSATRYTFSSSIIPSDNPQNTRLDYLHKTQLQDTPFSCSIIPTPRKNPQNIIRHLIQVSARYTPFPSSVISTVTIAGVHDSPFPVPSRCSAEGEMPPTAAPPTSPWTHPPPAGSGPSGSVQYDSLFSLQWNDRTGQCDSPFSLQWNDRTGQCDSPFSLQWIDGTVQCDSPFSLQWIDDTVQFDSPFSLQWNDRTVQFDSPFSLQWNDRTVQRDSPFSLQWNDRTVQYDSPFTFTLQFTVD